MNPTLRPASIAALALPLLLAGCSLFPTTRKLPVPKAPTITQTATPEDLVARLNKHWQSLDSLTATVEMQATVTKTVQGLAKDYPTLHGFILMRKPGMLRVVGQYLGIRTFDMASNGQEFTLAIPPQNKAIEGSNSMKKKSLNALENLRPGFFFDAMVVRGLEPDDLYQVTADTITTEDAAKKHLYLVPEYILNISRRKPGSQQLIPLRVVYFHRDDLEPFQQDIYDSEGNLETQVFYAGYQDFNADLYPSSIVIKRPLEDIRITLSVDKVTENQKLDDSQFTIQLPKDTQIQNLR